MAIEVKETDHETILVNGKEVYKDQDNNWIARTELSSQESLAFNNYLNAKPKDRIKVEFEDQGQDILWFIIDNVKRVILEAGPFHNSIFKGAIITNSIINEGGFISYAIGEDSGIMKYQIIKKTMV